MNYLISHTSTQHPFLTTTARKKTSKHKLISVEQGQIAVRLGKEEYLFTAGQLLWLPIECLVAISYLPNSRITEIDISIRSQHAYPHQAGLFNPTELLTALVNKFRTLRFEANNPSLQALYTVFIQELVASCHKKEHAPKLANNHPTVSQSLNDKSEDKALQLALKVREAFKMQKSGQARANIITTLFNGNEVQADQLCQLVADQLL
ncbi:hypothetical protein HC723_09290 [Vibrio sp. S11_S32]|uniref:hypothetical protein n=1 Tax=Vibrio sp. S11_S32 TaxID=2720225 RepID=UPI001680794A|nr:hypothetical protein [Vibrio sp. S11_S32]MBD1576631.1 hypothetical protein [Vibrio sp. S11_S32]